MTKYEVIANIMSNPNWDEELKVFKIELYLKGWLTEAQATMMYQISIELVSADGECIDSDGMDDGYAKDYKALRETAEGYVNGKKDDWGLIDSFKDKASPTDRIEIWIMGYNGDGTVTDYDELIGEIEK